jgi:hypothetical protein
MALSSGATPRDPLGDASRRGPESDRLGPG